MEVPRAVNAPNGKRGDALTPSTTPTCHQTPQPIPSTPGLLLTVDPAQIRSSRSGTLVPACHTPSGARPYASTKLLHDGYVVDVAGRKRVV